MPRPYNALRKAMKERSVTMVDISEALGCTMQTVSNKMLNRTPWVLEECWAVMTMMSLDPGKMAEYFPLKGRNE